MPPQYVVGVCRLLGANRTHTGMGILAEPRRVLTCAHVVNAALGRAFESEPRPEDSLTVEFPLARRRGEEALAVTGRVETWFPMASPPPCDIAVVLLDAAPAGVGPATFVAEDDLYDHGCQVYGFRPDAAGARDPKGGYVDGVIKGPLADDTVALVGADFTGLFIKNGYSGAAVWDKVLGAVVGMAREKDTANEGRVAYLTPVRWLKEAWPGLPVAPPRRAAPGDLKDVFVSLYPDRKDAERLAAEAGLSPGALDLSGKPRVFWAEILREAENQKALPVLIELASKEYPYANFPGRH